MKVLLYFLFSILLSAQTTNIRSVKLIQDMQQEQRVALVIGNSEYEGVLSKLRNPINDARTIKSILESRDFDVIYRKNSTRKEIKKALKIFYSKIRKGGVGLLYFSGHGIEVDGKNYLIPIDAELDEKSDAEFEAVAVNQITKKMQNAKNRLNIVILDACRNDPFIRAVGKGGLAKIEPIGLFVSYATGEGSVASDGKNSENGLFTKYLIKYMQQELNLQDVFKKTREEVYEASNHKQFPAIYDQTIRGKFFFTLPKKKSLRKSTFEIDEVLDKYSAINIDITPINSKIKFIGINQNYYNDIKLKNGKYNISISKDGYITKNIKLDLQSDINISLTLNREVNNSIISKDINSSWNSLIFKGKRSYSKNSENTVKDNYTSLIWTKKDSKEAKNWNKAVEYCQNLVLDGSNSWRLPTKKELFYLIDSNKFAPAIDTKYFNIHKSLTHHWTYTIYTDNNISAFGINFLAGGYENYKKDEKGYVLCVHN